MRTPVLLLLLCAVSPAQFVPGRYIVELRHSPAANGRQARMQSRVSAWSAQARVAAHLSMFDARVLDSTDTVANTLLVEADDTVAPLIAASPDVVRVHRMRVFKPYLDGAANVHNVPAVWNALGRENAGRGIRIGIIDSGIEATHTAFTQSSLPPLDGYPRVDSESNLRFTNSKIIAVRSYASLFSRADPDPSAADRVGHGTALAMAAAGFPITAPLGAISGIAPGAYIGVYKIFGTPGLNDGATDGAILKAIDDSVNDGMDVINLSFGSLLAPDPVSDIIVRALDSAEALGVVAVVAAGNDGPGLNTISSPATAGSAVAVGASENGRTFATVVSIGDKTYQSVPGSRSAGAQSVAGSLVPVAALDGSGLACSALPSGSLSGRIAFIARGVCNFEIKLNNAAAAGASAALVYTDEARPDAIPMGVGAATLPAAMISYADGSTILAALLAGNALDATVHFTEQAVPRNAFALADFSSIGPGAGNSVKPDLLAVGSEFYTATQTLDPRGDMYSSNGYINVNGTSFSAPVVAGAAAVLKGIRPGLTASDYRSLLVNSSRAFEPGLTLQQTGAGMLDLEAAVRSTVAVAPHSLSFGVAPAGGTISRVFTLRNVSAEPRNYRISVQPRTGEVAPFPGIESVDLGSGQSTEVAVTFDAAATQPGAYSGYIAITDDQGAGSRIAYWFARPFDTGSSIQVLHNVDTARSGSVTEDAIVFRVLDASGVALQSTPDVSVVLGGGVVTAIRHIDADVAGAFSLDVQPGFGTNVIRVQSGSAVTDLTIRGR